MKQSCGYDKLRKDLTADTLCAKYVFYGEETFLKEHYKKQIVAKIGQGGFEEFNICVLEGAEMSFSELSDAVQSLPVMSQIKLILIRDFNFSKVDGELKELMAEITADELEGVCLIFYFDTIEYKPDKRIKLWQNVLKSFEIVEFAPAPQKELEGWIKRRFAAKQKDIDSQTCEYLTFSCGNLMTRLSGEIDKIASGAKGGNITREDIDLLGSRVLDAQIFELTNCVSEANHQKAIAILRDLISLKFEPVVLTGAIGKQIQKLYCAKMADKNGMGEEYLMRLFAMRSQYPATLLFRASQKRSLPWLRQAVLLCAETDIQIKSNISDSGRTLELLLLRIANLKL